MGPVVVCGSPWGGQDKLHSVFVADGHPCAAAWAGLAPWTPVFYTEQLTAAHYCKLLKGLFPP